MSLSLVPRPAIVQLGSGHFDLDADTAIYSSEVGEAECRRFAEILRAATGLPLPVKSDPSGAIAFRLEHAVAHLGLEGYRLNSSADGVQITAATPAGLFYGVQTLLQLLPASSGALGSSTSYEISFLHIQDYPRFKWRGAMIDVARYFMPLEFIKKFIDQLAMHKMNVLHLHLTDDQGWRVEIKKYPRLTEIGSQRSGTLIGHFDGVRDDYVVDGVSHGGYYTQAEVRDLVKYAAERYITLVPEIDMPGHAQAAIAAYPEFGTLSEPVEVATMWGVKEYLFSPEEHSLSFLRDVLTEVMDLFPSEYIHVGGDEAVKTQWRSSPRVQDIIRELGLSGEDQLQSYFISRVGEFLSDHKRRLIGWEEIMEGGLPKDAVVMPWRSTDPGIVAAKDGHDVIMAPLQYTYLDSYQSEDTESEPLAIGGCLPLAGVYDYDPVPAVLGPKAAKHILGAQAQLWTEYMPNPDHVEYMAFPRLCAFAEVVWTAQEARDFSDFTDRLKSHLGRLDALGVKYRPLSPA